MRIAVKALAIFLMIAINGIAQNLSPISTFTIKDKLSKDDLIDPTLGRYDAYQINVGKGDLIAFKLYAKKFVPFLLLISPSQKAILRTPSVKKMHEVSFDTVAFEQGNWDMYIIGDTSAFGNYTCIVGFAAPKSVVLKKFNFCEKLKFLFNQSNANFLFLNTDSIIKYFSLSDSNVTINNRDNYVKFKLAEFNSENDLSQKFKELVKLTSECLGDKFYSKKVKPSGSLSSVIIIENAYKNNHYVIFSKKKDKKKYFIELRIGREK